MDMGSGGRRHLGDAQGIADLHLARIDLKDGSARPRRRLQQADKAEREREQANGDVYQRISVPGQT